MKFGILKSKIENVLLESYKKNTFKTEVKNFKKLVLENKSISKIFYLYNELSSNKGMESDVVSDYINECITIYENTINKIDNNDIIKLKKWVGNDKTNNIYETVDGLFNNDVLFIHKKINSRKEISESLQKKPQVINETSINLPLKSMINIANKTLSNYISSLNENDKNELTSLLSESDEALKPKYDEIKSEVVGKLNKVLTETEQDDVDTLNRITETLDKITSDEYNKVNYYRLNNLNKVL
jgi:hypothetical protein